MICVFKIVVSDPKTRRTYQKEVPYMESGLLGRKIGEKVKGDFLGLPGYELQVTGGSDKQGFPMRQDMQGIGRKKFLLTGGTGFHPLRKGERRRKLVRGNTLSEEIVQVNMKVLTYGKDTLAKLFGKEEKKETKHEEKKEEHKEEKHEKAEEHKKEEHKAEHAEHKPEHAEKKHEDQKAEHAEHKHEGHKEHEKPEHKETKHEEHHAEHTSGHEKKE